MIYFLLRYLFVLLFNFFLFSYAEIFGNIRYYPQKRRADAQSSARPDFRLDYVYEKAFDTFYKLHWTASSWSDARMRCEAEGSELLVPTSLDEADSMPLITAPLLFKHEGIFVGIHDLYSERTFVTLRGSDLLNTMLSLLWEYTEPKHGAGRCVAMRRTGRLFVQPCDEPLPFVCKIKADKISYNENCTSYDKRWVLGPDNKCYFVNPEPQTWNQAYGTCIGAGGYLVILTNTTEGEYVKNIYMDTEPSRIPENNFAYLGFSDHFMRHHFTTVHGQSMYELGFKDWEETCEKRDSILNNTQCGGIRRSGQLATEACPTIALFICEKPADNVFSWNRSDEIKPLDENKRSENDS